MRNQFAELKRENPELEEELLVCPGMLVLNKVDKSYKLIE